MIKKGVFPYSWLDHPSKLECTPLHLQLLFNDLSETACINMIDNKIIIYFVKPKTRTYINE